MQQYFIDSKLNVNQIVDLNPEVIYHLTKVLRKTNKTFRLVDEEGTVFLANLNLDNKAIIKEKLDEYNELDIDITAIVALVKSDKFEMILQKLTELGVKRIVPFNAVRSIVKETKTEKKLERYKKILTEAAEQSHRNFVPEILPAIDFKDLNKYMSELNFVAYEKDDNSDYSLKAKSITYIIGPEGGFEQKEISEIIKLGFKSISLGNRILRAETAAIYLTSIIVGANQ